MRIIRNHSLDIISFCLEKVSSLIRHKPFLLRGIKLGKVTYVLGNNEVPPEGPQSKGNSSDDKNSDNEVAHSWEGAASSTPNAAKGDK